MEEMVDALVMEIALRKNYLGDNSIPLETIYFGGGTPSLLNEEQLNRIFDAIRSHYVIAAGAEVTLEANPDDLSKEKLQMLRLTPVNRLSIGVQSFFDEDLKLMNRAHRAEEAVRCVFDAAAAGFDNITIDLMYGLPGMNEARWGHNLEKAFALPVQHLSCYCLTIEKRTALEKYIREGSVAAPDEEMATQHFMMLMDAAAEHGFEHYEISNFSKPGYRSRHNSSYWSGKPYIGIGPSAHSYNGASRQWNIASNSAYISAIQKGEVPATSEQLTLQNRYNEYVMTRLRTLEGIDAEHITQEFGEEFLADFLAQVDPWLHNSAVEIADRKVRLTRSGKLLADRITAALFV
jgi:oxygen-independent coproporphyrinogen-3 oxidase